MDMFKHLSSRQVGLEIARRQQERAEGASGLPAQGVDAQLQRWLSTDERVRDHVQAAFDMLSQKPAWSTSSPELRWRVAKAAVMHVFDKDPDMRDIAGAAMDGLVEDGANADVMTGVDQKHGVPLARRRPGGQVDEQDFGASLSQSLSHLRGGRSDHHGRVAQAMGHVLGGSSSSSRSSSNPSATAGGFMQGMQSLGEAIDSGADTKEARHLIRQAASRAPRDAAEMLEEQLYAIDRLPSGLTHHIIGQISTVMAALKTVPTDVVEMTFVPRAIVDRLNAVNAESKRAAAATGHSGKPDVVKAHHQTDAVLAVLGANADRYEKFIRSDLARRQETADLPVWALVAYSEILAAPQPKPAQDTKAPLQAHALPDLLHEPVPEPLPHAPVETGETTPVVPMPPTTKRRRKKLPRGALVGTAPLNPKGDPGAGHGRTVRRGTSHHDMGKDKSLPKWLRDLAGRPGKKWNHQLAVRAGRG